tara:strand:- start:307 stop:525 length:219 start_codon:yes stop_codon:yes gene_type:complete
MEHYDWNEMTEMRSREYNNLVRFNSDSEFKSIVILKALNNYRRTHWFVRAIDSIKILFMKIMSIRLTFRKEG